MLKPSSIRRIHPQPHSAGFTLVEMLISVALVLLMMSMFAGVFVTSTDSLSTQRGIAENDQRGRLLTMTIRGDLDERTFRDVLPFRANEDTRSLGHSLSRRAGYLEIDEGNPSDDTDDSISFTASVNIRLQSKDASPFVGSAQPLSGVNATVVGNSFVISGNYTSLIAPNTRIWVVGNPNIPYSVTSVVPSGSNTIVNVFQTISQSGAVSMYLSENEPEFDDGDFHNQMSVSALAEVSYFLRNGILYRRILLIRDTPSGVDGQPSWSTGVPVLWNDGNANTNLPKFNNNSLTGDYSLANGAATTFWRDFDYSAFYYTGNGAGAARGVRFHSSAESLSNSNQVPQILTNPVAMAATSFPFSLGIPHWRFGHSTTNGLPQDASTIAFLNGVQVNIGRFNLQECANTNFGYPGNINNGNPFDNQNLIVDPATGLVTAFEGVAPPPPARRGQDILMSNVLSFDVKVWDPINLLFVDVGNNTSPGGAFSADVGVITDTNGNIVGGRLNSTYGAGYGSGFGVNGTNGHYRFDTWHPNASTTTTTLPLSAIYPSPPYFYNEPPYYQPPPYYNNNPIPPAPYTYSEPPYVPVVRNPVTNQLQATPLSAIQIKINFRDISSNQIRQVTIVQSLVDRVKGASLTNEAPQE